MKTRLLWVVLLSSACGRQESARFEEEGTSSQVVVRSRVRLSASFEAREGHRFSDGATLTVRDVEVCRGAYATQTQTAEGTVVTDELARVDLQASLGRYLIVSAPGDGLCEVDPATPATCGTWALHQFIHINAGVAAGGGLLSSRGRVFLLRTQSAGTLRLTVVDNGVAADGHFVEFEVGR